MNMKQNCLDEEDTIGIFYKNIHNLIRDNYLIRLRNEPIPICDDIKLTNFVKEKLIKYGMDCLKVGINAKDEFIDKKMTINFTKKDMSQNNKVKFIVQLAEKMVYFFNDIIGENEVKDKDNSELFFWFSNSLLCHEKIISEENLAFVIDNYNMIFEWKLNNLPTVDTKNIFNFSSYKNDDYNCLMKNLNVKNNCKVYGDSIISVLNDGIQTFFIIQGLSYTCVITQN